MTATVRPEGGEARIIQVRRDPAVVIRPVGALDEALADDIRELALEAHAPVVLDLGDCVLTNRRSIRRVALAWKLYRPHLCIVCHRDGGRQMLERAGIPDHLAVFDSLDEAMDALHRFGRDGWSPATAAPRPA